jgi:hypothetical protein
MRQNDAIQIRISISGKYKEKSGNSKDRLTDGQFTPNLIRFTQHSLHHTENAKTTSSTSDV